MVGRVEVVLAEIGISGPVSVESDVPVAVERRLVFGEDQTSSTVAVPRFGSITLPEPVG